MLGSVRSHVHIHRPAEEVWALVGDPVRLPEWFPGIVEAVVDGTTRTITTGTGISMPEEITVADPLLRRFQYRITAPIVADHRSTIDVLDLADGTCVASYACDAEPRTFALMIGAGGAHALENLKRLLEADDPTDGSEP